MSPDPSTTEIGIPVEQQGPLSRFVDDELLPRWMRVSPISDGKTVQIKLVDDATAATTGDGKFIFFIPEWWNNLALIDCDAYVTTVSSSGALTVQIRNVTDSVDLLSTAITIDESEFSSLTAATASVINRANAIIQTGDRIAIDVDGAGTGAKGLGVVLIFG